MQRSDPSKLSGNAHNDTKDVDILNWGRILVATMTLFVISPHFVLVIFQFIFTVFIPNAVLLFKRLPCC